MRKDLQQAHHLAAEQHSLEYYKQLLLDFHEAKIADQEAKVAKAQAKKEKAEKSSKKSEAVAIDNDDDDDMDLDDIGEDDAAPKKAKPAKKRKADEDVGVRAPPSLTGPLGCVLTGSRHLNALIPSKSPR